MTATRLDMSTRAVCSKDGGLHVGTLTREQYMARQEGVVHHVRWHDMEPTDSTETGDRATAHGDGFWEGPAGE